MTDGEIVFVADTDRVRIVARPPLSIKKANILYFCRLQRAPLFFLAVVRTQLRRGQEDSVDVSYFLSSSDINGVRETDWIILKFRLESHILLRQTLDPNLSMTFGA